MEKKTIIDKVKELFNEDVEKVEVKFEDLKDVDGNILRVESLEIGQPVMIITEEGEELSPAAEYTLEDGRRLIVDQEGLITEVVEAEGAPEDEVEMEEEVVEEMEEEVVEPTVSLEDKINETITRKTKELEEKLDNLLAKFESVSEKVSELANEPAEEEIKINKAGFKSANKPSSVLDEIGKFRK